MRRRNRQLSLIDLIYGNESDPNRPKDRSECRGGYRPCPYWSCRYHLGLDVDNEGNLTEYRANEIDGMPAVEIDPSCALDIADRGPATLEEISRMVGLSLEAVRQIELKAIRNIRLHTERINIRED